MSQDTWGPGVSVTSLVRGLEQALPSLCTSVSLFSTSEDGPRQSPRSIPEVKHYGSVTS